MNFRDLPTSKRCLGKSEVAALGVLSYRRRGKVETISRILKTDLTKIMISAIRALDVLKAGQSPVLTK